METVMIKIKNNKIKGFALLYAVVVSSMLLAVALGVSNIAYKEIIFSTSAKDANEAFYAADTAAECTLYYDAGVDTTTNLFMRGSTNGEKCNDQAITGFTYNDILNPPPGYPFDRIFTFTVSKLGNSQKACANVTVEKIAVDNSSTKITSVGYNNGGETAGDCTPNVVSVQRALELNY